LRLKKKNRSYIMKKKKTYPMVNFYPRRQTTSRRPEGQKGGKTDKRGERLGRARRTDSQLGRGDRRDVKTGGREWISSRGQIPRFGVKMGG